MNTELISRNHFVAVTPMELAPAQAQVIGWCIAKIRSLGSELREQRENLRQAKTMKWRHTGWLKAVAKTKARMVYYAKLKTALHAGYLIVPNFDVDVVAVRVSKGATPSREVDRRDAEAELLPPGKGTYVDDLVLGYEETRTVIRSDKSSQVITDFRPTDFDEQIDFPIALAKPAVLAATDRAMALRLFDRIGVVRGGRKSDPIVVGQIIDPRTPTAYGARRNNPRCVSFFIAWWLDPRDL